MRLGMSADQVRAAVASDVHTNARLERSVGPEPGSERLKYYGTGETIALLFWANHLIDIKVELDLPSPGDADAYLEKMRSTFGPETRADWRNEHGLEQRTFYWEADSARVSLFRSAPLTFLHFEDVPGLARMARESRLPLPPRKQETPGLE